MKINQLTKSSLLRKQLKNGLGYFANGKIKPMYEDCNNFKPWLLIVARKHYSILHKSYPALSLTELKALLKISQQHQNTLKSLIEITINKEIDGFDVKTIIFDNEYATQLSQAWLLIPETEVLAQQLTDKQLYELHTPVGLLFYSQSDFVSHSAYCGGLIHSITTYKHSIGVADDVTVNKIAQQHYLSFLAEQFSSLSVTQLPKIASFNKNNKVSPWQLHALYWGPLLSISLYLAVAVGWQWFSISQTEQAIASQSENANELLLQKQQLDQLNSKIALFNQHIANHPLALSDWEVVNSALSTGMIINRFSFRQGKLTLTGESANANATISEITKLSQVKSAIFTSGVRKYRGSERFEIEITLNSISPSGVSG
ncbi:hypothetical protein [Pseudoalteromonas mariniglutinosa]|uniref:hypothetical protein n=1 Tax=Pseudoalteromonas mariniglutinosa TaxID=206042 RepID=UPI00384FB732